MNTNPSEKLMKIKRDIIDLKNEISEKNLELDKKKLEYAYEIAFLKDFDFINKEIIDECQKSLFKTRHDLGIYENGSWVKTVVIERNDTMRSVCEKIDAIVKKKNLKNVTFNYVGDYSL